MARSRNIKPGFFDNEILAELDPLARLLFIGLWCIADREGRLEDRPKRIKKELLGYDDCDCNALLQSLCERGFIERYSVGENAYIQIVTFAKHQKPHQNETASSIPPNILHQDNKDLLPRCEVCTTMDTSTRADYLLSERYNLIPDSLNIDCGGEANASFAERSAEADPSPTMPVITLTLNDKSEFPVFEEQIHQWAELYPAVDIMQQLRGMKGWLYANPAKRKTKAGIMRFINSWLAKEQDRGGDGKRAPPKTSRNLFHEYAAE